MIRRIVLMRHAKSSWKSGALSDHQRPLNGRGRKAAPRVAAELRRLGWIPERVLASDSTRTTETWERMQPQLASAEVEFHRALYHAGIDEVLEAGAACPDEVSTVLLLGHNPGWEDALAWLSGEHEEMKTGVAALLSLDAESWAEAMSTPRRWRLQGLIAPRDLG